MRVAVVGGGVFGCSAATMLTRAGHRVDLYEKSPTLLSGASSHNQFRLHEGYHYPRSPETGAECRTGLESFRAEYAQATEGGSQFYAIAPDSKVRPVQYTDFLDRSGLYYKGTEGKFVDNVDLVVRVREERYDPWALCAIVEENMRRIANLYLGVEAHPEDLKDYDQIVLATYDRLGEWTGGEWQFEVVEKPVVWIPPCEFTAYKTGVVILDGPFCSLDPMGRTGLYVLGHVEHAIHFSNVGTKPYVPLFYRQMMHRGVVVPGQRLSRYRKMVDDAAKYLPVLKTALYVGSMFTIRTVLPNVDDTDKRPTQVARIDDRTIRIFSGKVPTCVEAGKQVAAMLGENRMAA